MTLSVTLIVKAPNQQIEDQTVKCELSWTILKLKGHLSEVYPSKPVSVINIINCDTFPALFRYLALLFIFSLTIETPDVFYVSVYIILSLITFSIIFIIITFMFSRFAGSRWTEANILWTVTLRLGRFERRASKLRWTEHPHCALSLYYSSVIQIWSTYGQPPAQASNGSHNYLSTWPCT